jgi:hypothetical protein
MFVLTLLTIQTAIGSNYTSDKDMGSGSVEITHSILHSHSASQQKQNYLTGGEMGSGSGEMGSGSGEMGSGSGEMGSGSQEFPSPPPPPQEQEYQTIIILSVSASLFVSSAIVVAYTFVPVLSPSYGLLAV